MTTRREKTVALLKALQRLDYRPADFIAAEINTDKPFVYQWCSALTDAGLVEVKSIPKFDGVREVYMWRWKK